MQPETDRLARWAQHAGEQALPLFALLLALLLALAAALWWAVRRPQPHRSQGRLPPLLVLTLRMAMGLAVLVAAAAAFATIAQAIGDGRRLGRADEVLTAALRSSVPEAALQVFALLTRFADTATLTLLCGAVALLLWRRRQRLLAVGWVAAVVGNALLNTALKQVFERVRPLHDDGLVQAQGYSFPSGHTSGAVVAYGMLAYLGMRLLPARWHLPALLVAVATAFTVGASRVFLRVHWASDVAAGFVSGSIWLAICIASIEVTRWYRQRRD